MNTDAVGTAPSRYTFRPARREDVPAIQHLLTAIAAIHPESYAPSLADVESDFDDPWANQEADSRLAFAPDGTLAAHFHLIANPEPPDDARAYLDDDVHPAHRNHGLEDELLDWLETRGTERLRAIAADHPQAQPLTLRLGCWDTEHERIDRYRRRGFEAVRYYYRMRRDLRQPIPARTLPPGLVLRPYGPDLDERARQTRNEAFRDGWSFDPVSPAEWQQFFVQRTDFRPDLSFAVLDGDEVAAISMNRFDPLAAERTGRRMGWIGSLATRRPWRQRGLASALLAASMRAFQAAGLDYAGLGVDAANPSGAVSLYESVGFATYATSLAFAKTVSAQPRP